MALENGSLIIFGGFSNPSVLYYQNHHISPITELIISPCGKYIMTAGMDCMIYVYEIGVILGDAIANSMVRESSTVVDEFLADVVLINKK